MQCLWLLYTTYTVGQIQRRLKILSGIRSTADVVASIVERDRNVNTEKNNM